MTRLVALGIMSIGPSKFTDREWINQFNRQNEEWWLLGHGKKTNDNCGRPVYYGCPEPESHYGFKTLDGLAVAPGSGVVQVGHNSCNNPKCPQCYQAWAWRGAQRITYRLEHYRGPHSKAIHCIASVPRRLYHASKEKLEKEAVKIAKKAGMLGWCKVYHKDRQACMFCGAPKENHKHVCDNCGGRSFGWHYGPHFHFLGFGWITHTDEIYDRSGWIFKNYGVRKSVVATAYYELSHCTVDYSSRASGRSRHSVTWGGCLSYHSLKVPKMEKERKLCPICGSELVRMYYCGPKDLSLDPMAVGIHYVDASEWRVLRGAPYG